MQQTNFNGGPVPKKVRQFMDEYKYSPHTKQEMFDYRYHLLQRALNILEKIATDMISSATIEELQDIIFMEQEVERYSELDSSIQLVLYCGDNPTTRRVPVYVPFSKEFELVNLMSPVRVSFSFFLLLSLLLIS